MPELPVISVIADAGLTPAQETSLAAWLAAHPARELHHDGTPAAERVVVVAQQAGVPRVVAHPPWDGRSCSRLALEASDGQTTPAPYWPRLQALLDACHVLVLLPRPEVGTRTGDAARLARLPSDASRHLVRIDPAGEVFEEGS